MSAARTALLAFVLAAPIAGCAATSGPVGLTTGSVEPAATEPPVRGTAVVPGRPARVFVMAGLGAKCEQTGAPVITVDKQPGKGTVTLQPGQKTTIQFSRTGKCIGHTAPGTGIYYTAQAGQTGSDTFTITGRIGKDEPMTQTFTVQIAE